MMLRLIVQSGIKMWMGSVYFTTYKSLSEQTKVVLIGNHILILKTNFHR